MSDQASKANHRQGRSGEKKRKRYRAAKWVLGTTHPNSPKLGRKLRRKAREKSLTP